MNSHVGYAVASFADNNLKLLLQHLHEVDPRKCRRFRYTLVITYIAGALIAFVMFWSHSGDFSISRNFNWPSVILGFAIVGLEAGYVYLFRAGWQISKGSLTANICLAIVLLFVGFFMYGEKISLRQIIGALVCMAGLYMINAQ